MSTRAREMSDYVLAKSWQCRHFPGRVRHLVNVSHCILEAAEKEEGTLTEKKAKWLLRKELRGEIEQTVGNPALILIMAQIILPIVIKYAIEWWLAYQKRKKEEADV